MLAALVVWGSGGISHFILCPILRACKSHRKGSFLWSIYFVCSLWGLNEILCDKEILAKLSGASSEKHYITHPSLISFHVCFLPWYPAWDTQHREHKASHCPQELLFALIMLMTQPCVQEGAVSDGKLCSVQCSVVRTRLLQCHGSMRRCQYPGGPLLPLGLGWEWVVLCPNHSLQSMEIAPGELWADFKMDVASILKGAVFIIDSQDPK